MERWLLYQKRHTWFADVGQKDVENFYSSRPTPPEDEAPHVNGVATPSGTPITQKGALGKEFGKSANRQIFFFFLSLMMQTLFPFLGVGLSFSVLGCQLRRSQNSQLFILSG